MTVSCKWGLAITAPTAVSGVRSIVHRSFSPQSIDGITERRECRVEGYLQRKLHRQWRNRGS